MTRQRIYFVAFVAWAALAVWYALVIVTAGDWPPVVAGAMAWFYARRWRESRAR